MANPMWEILQAVDASVKTVTGVPTTSVRYKLELFGDETVPLVIIAPGKRIIKKRTFKAGTNIWYDYEVHVALVTAGNRKSASGLQAYLQLQQDLNYQLTQVLLAGVAAVFDSNIDSDEIPKFAARVAGNYDVCGWTVKYTDAETTKG